MLHYRTVTAGTGLLLALSALVATSYPVDAQDGGDRDVARTPSGMVVHTITDGRTTITTYGPDVPDVKVSRTTANVAEVTLNVSAPSGAEAKQVGAGAHPTVYEMSLASGMSPAEACEFALDMGDGGCRTAAEVARTPSVGAMLEAGGFLDADCFDFKHTPGDGTKYNHACVTRFRDFTGRHRKFIGTKMKATGWQDNGGLFNDSINGVGIRAEYAHDDAYAVDWDPYSTDEVGSCRSVEVSAESPKSGASYSTSTEVCPEKISPWHSPAFQYFGSKWTGDPAPEEERRGVVAASVVSIPRSGTTAYAIRAWLRWT